MFDVGLLILNITMVVATTWIVYQYWGIFFSKRKWNIAVTLVWAAFVVFQMMVAYEYGTGSIWMTVINAVLILLISNRKYFNII